MVIDSFVRIKPVGGKGDIVIGENTPINSGVVIFSGDGVHIGENVIISLGCMLVPLNHEYRDKNIIITEQRFTLSRGGLKNEDHVWIGANTTILDGTVINKGAVIGANSLVEVGLKPYCVNTDNPLKQIGQRT